MHLCPVFVSIDIIFEDFLTDMTSYWLLSDMLGSVMPLGITSVVEFVPTEHAYELAIELSDPFSLLF